jgi:copper chaperone CopZ
MRLTLTIDGMLAVHAKHGVFTALNAVSGVVRAEVNLGRATIDVAASPAQIAEIEAQLREAVALVGCTVVEIHRQSRTLPSL